MPIRDEPFVINEFYHVFNKTIDRRKIFKSTIYCNLFIELLRYYRSTKSTLSYSKLKRIPKDLQNDILKEVNEKNTFKVNILAYCLMPTHFHLLLRQKTKQGVQSYISNILNSFTRFFNIRTERKGPLFLPKFKSVRILSREQLIHVSRYIHLNPYSCALVSSMEELEDYKWSSFREYKPGVKNRLFDGKQILDEFGNKYARYRNFVVGNADYQKTLEYIKHAEKW